MPHPPRPSAAPQDQPAAEPEEAGTEPAEPGAPDGPATARGGWAVHRVRDPAGGGADFAHTIGLSGLGLPELHLWARPTLGDDPGADWMLSGHDQHLVLARAADRLLAGELTPGTQWSETFDGDLTQARFTAGPPTPAERLDAYRLDGDQPVLPLRYSLHRPEPGPLTALDPDTAARVDAWTRMVRAQTDRLRAAMTAQGLPAPTVPPPWRLPPAAALGDPVEVDPGQPFGPLHALVVARAGQLVVADPHTLAEFVLRIAAARGVGATAGVARAVLDAACRPVGRGPALANAVASAALVLEQVAGRSRVTRRWREACLVAGGPPGGRAQRGFEAGTREEVLPWVEVTLAVEVLADVLSQTHLALCRGPWTWAVHQGGGAPDTAWQADPEPVEQVAGLLAGWQVTDAERLVERFRTGDQREFAAAAATLSGCCTVGAGSPPAGRFLLPAAVRDELHPADALLCEHLARTLVAALAFRDVLAPAGRAAVAALFGRDPRDLGQETWSRQECSGR